MYKTSIKHCVEIEQNTPMIHFQYKESKMCLRPSEVKPKLDKFIIACLGGWKNIPVDWHVDKDHHALRYKMRIIANVESKVTPHKLYFANIGDKNKEKIQNAVNFKDIKLSIICNCKGTVIEPKLTNEEMSLMEIIKEYLPYFFAVHTFGQRNSKGFGSFSVKESQIDYDKLLEFCPLKQYYYIDYNQKDFFDDIWVIYNMMKSGFNFTNKNNQKSKDDYYKGRIFKYFTDKGFGSDKVFIKQKILLLAPRNGAKKYETFYFSRAMLGLTENYKFSTDQVSVNHTFEDEKFKIERFQSPIRFNIHGTRLLIIPQVIPKRMFDAQFEFEYKNNKESIKTPPSSGDHGFQLIEYLDWFIKQFNEKTNMEQFSKITVKATINKDLTIVKAGEANEE